MMLLGPSRVVGLAGVRSACVLRAFSSGVSGGGESGRVQQLKTLVKQYGPVAMGVHISIGLVTLAGFYAAVKAGVDFSGRVRVWMDACVLVACSLACLFA